jgi:hypothetical protein
MNMDQPNIIRVNSRLNRLSLVAAPRRYVIWESNFGFWVNDGFK